MAFINRLRGSKYLQKCLYCGGVRNYSIIEDDLCKYIEEDTLVKFERSCELRGHENNMTTIRKLVAQLQMKTPNCEQVTIRKELFKEILKLPNLTHPRVMNYGITPKEVIMYKSINFLRKNEEFSKICKKFNLLRMEHLGHFTGHKSYYLVDFLADLEQALIQYTIRNLKLHKFRLISVPDILPAIIINSCGMQTETERTQVYKLDSGKCLSGTSEMALAGYFKNNLFEESQLPLRVAAVSRCYRAETSSLKQENGIYRVHFFTKVEMFCICSAKQSENILEHFKDIEVKLFKNLNLSFRLLDMPSNELGTPAYQKYDIEAWMPGKKMWGEISSCSNCTDYQARRLNIKYRSNEGHHKYVHTVNGTGAAIPRLLIALMESLQNDSNIIILPEVLSHFMKNKALKYKNKTPEIKLVKSLLF